MGRSYTDEQLSRIIVPRRFTLRRHRSNFVTEAGFSGTAIPLNLEKRPEFSDAEILQVLQYRWPVEFAGLEHTDIADVDRSARGGGMHLESGVDPLNLDDPTLSEHIHELIYEDARKRAEILNDFKRELAEAKELGTPNIEGLFNDFEPHILEYIFVARIYMAMSWNKIARSLERRGKKPAGFLGDRGYFDRSTVKLIYQIHSNARTRVFDECVKNKDSVQRVMEALPPEIRDEHEERSKLSTKKPAVLRKVLFKEPLDCHLSLTKTEKRSKRRNTPSISSATESALRTQGQELTRALESLNEVGEK